MLLLKPMTNLKKLRAINLFLIVMLFGLLSCARAPHKSLFTDRTINENIESHFPLVIVSDSNFLSPVLPQYLARTKKEFPQTKFILLITEQYQPAILQKQAKSLALFDASMLIAPTPFEQLPEVLQKKPIINSHIYDIRNDERFLESKTLPYLSIQSEGQSILLLSAAEIKLNSHLNKMDEDDDFRFFTIEAMNSLMRARKELRKNPPQLIGFISSESDKTLLDEKKHEYLNVTAIPFITPDYFLVKNKKIQLCEWFYKATDDCFQSTGAKAVDLNDNIIKDREKLLEKNQERKEATYMGEEIESQALNPSSTY